MQKLLQVKYFTIFCQSKTINSSGTYMRYLIMNRKEREQAKIFEQVKLGIITKIEAAARLGFSGRWVKKKVKRYYEQEDRGLIHRSRENRSSKRWDIQNEKLLIELFKVKWYEFGPKFTTEKLEELYSIKASIETVRPSMIRLNIWQPKQKRSKHRKRRERRAMLELMVQLDGSHHD